MITISWMRLAAGVASFVLLVLLVREELSWRRERAQFEGQIAAAQKLVQEADVRQRNRDEDLRGALQQIEQRKRQVQTPQQIVRELPRDLPLPSPIVLPSAEDQPATGSEGGKNPPQHPDARLAGETPARNAEIPVEDLKPLFNFVQDCKACQAQLTTARSDLADEKAKSAALAQERDSALRMARGGGFWRRLGRAAKWFTIGAIAGAAAAAASR